MQEETRAQSEQEQIMKTAGLQDSVL